MARTFLAESQHLGIKVPLVLFEKLQKIAKRENNGVSAVCRRLLTQAVQQEGAATAPHPELVSPE